LHRKKQKHLVSKFQISKTPGPEGLVTYGSNPKHQPYLVWRYFQRLYWQEPRFEDRSQIRCESSGTPLHFLVTWLVSLQHARHIRRYIFVPIVFSA
jgi:hypothetical protein